MIQVVIAIILLLTPHLHPGQNTTADDPMVIGIDFDKTTVYIPCHCDIDTPFWRAKREEKPQLRIHSRVENKAGGPLNYHYSVSAGRIIGQGAAVIWDFQGLEPGNYLVTAVVDDGSGMKGIPMMRNVELEEPCCLCPCECPTIETYSHNVSVKRGETLDFEARITPGFGDKISYHWTVLNGKIVSGQGMPKVVVATEKKSTFHGVVATVSIGGLDPVCSCPVTSSAEVALGNKTQVQKFPTSVGSLNLDEDALYIACSAGVKPISPSQVSRDLVIDVLANATSNSVFDRLNYTYQVSGGKIIGSGPNVRWDLSGAPPGTYSISAFVDDGSQTLKSEKRNVTVAQAPCPDLIECPKLSLSKPRAATRTGDFIVEATVTGGGYREGQYVWSATDAELIAGQGTPSIKVRPTSATNDAVVTFEFQMAEEELAVCANTETVMIPRAIK